MKWKHRLPGLTVGMMILAVAVSVNAQQQQKQPPGQSFQNWDKNGDGKLTRDELPERIKQNFDRVDTNKDGFISRAEDAAFRNRVRRGESQRGQNMRRVPRMPDSIQVMRDIPYAGNDNPRQKLDLYLPKKPASSKPLPVVVWIHGGAWRAGHKAGGFGNLRSYVASGDFAGVSVGYRLTDESTWPAQIHDCKAAIRWIRGNARKHNLDPDRIGVWGSSAGGHLVAMLGTSGEVKALEGKLGKHLDQSSRVTCVVDYFGPSDLLAMGRYPSNMDHDAPTSPESILVGGPVQQTRDVAKSASTTTYVSKDDPPFLIVHGDKDMTVPYNQSVRLNDLMKKNNLDVTLITVTEGGHGGFASDELNRRVRAFLDKHLRDRDAEVKGGTVPRGARGAGR